MIISVYTTEDGIVNCVENEKINDPTCKIYEVDDDYDFGAIDPLDLAQDLYENEKTSTIGIRLVG